MYRDDLGRRHRRQVHRVARADPAPVPCDQLVTVPPDLDGRPAGSCGIQPSVLQPAAGRSNQMCIWPVPTEFSYLLNALPGAHADRPPNAATIIR